MLSPDTMLHLLSMKEDNSRDMTIQQLYQFFSVYQEEGVPTISGVINRMINGINLVDNKEIDYEIMVTDLHGWTRVTGIYCMHKPIDVDWITLSVFDQKASEPIQLADVTVFSDMKGIPKFDKADSLTGFHGEVKYHYNGVTTRNDSKYNTLSFDEIIQAYADYPNKGIRYVNSGDDFIINPKITKSYPNERETNVPIYGYSISTESGFFNANNFVMIGHNPINPDAYK